MTDKKKPSSHRKASLFPKTLGQCIEPVTRPVLKEKGLAGSRILTQWPSIVGKELAKHCIPEKLSFPKGKKTGGTLVIAAENGFAPDIQHHQPVILERLAAYFGYQAISRISISHSYLPPAVAQTPVPKPTKPPLSLDRDIVAMTNDVEDDELRQSLQSLAQTLSKAST